jgi:lipopolysaccharide export system protein LptA
MTGDRVLLDFVSGEGGSVLSHASGVGACVVESKPLAAAGRPLPETHVLRASAVLLMMRPDGRDIAEALTNGPGDLEFLPNLPVQRYRKLSSERMHVVYGPRSRVESCRAVDARTLTEPNAEERKRNRAPSTTRSRNLLARFDAAGKLATMEQWDDFFYEEGGRKARAARAAMDGDSNVITLETAARVWDATGFTAADRIRMDEKAGVFTAEGHVSSSRLPDQDKSKKRKTSEMLSGDDPTQATARKMTSTNHNRHVLYEGGVVMWQGANRILGDMVELDREKRTLVAEGHVVTHMWEQPQPPKDAAAKKKAAAPKAAVLTLVRAPRLVYTEQDRLAHYTGGVAMSRPAMQVKAADLRAFLAEQGAESRLDKAFADGKVEILQTAPDRTRTGAAEHAEYFTGEQKVILRGGAPQLADSLRGATRGAELTYFANDDRLLVNGSPEQPAGSRIRRK